MNKLFLLFCFFLSGLVIAADETDLQSVDSGEWHIRLSAGLGRVENPLAKTDDIKVPVLPSVSYYGDRFYLNNFNLGYALYETDSFAVDIEGILNEDGIYYQSRGFKQSVLAASIFGNRNPASSIFIPDDQFDRKLSYLAGPSLTYQYGFGELYLGYFTDITGTHDGQEAQLSLSWAEQMGNHIFRIEAGLIYKSDKLQDYYYSSVFARRSLLNGSVREFDLYTAESGKNTYASLYYEYLMDQNWSVVARLKHTRLNDEIRQSVIIHSDRTIDSFIGISYRF